jgi:hypothetical protein
MRLLSQALISLRCCCHRCHLATFSCILGNRLTPLYSPLNLRGDEGGLREGNPQKTRESRSSGKLTFLRMEML